VAILLTRKGIRIEEIGKNAEIGYRLNCNIATEYVCGKAPLTWTGRSRIKNTGSSCLMIYRF
jgi:hypothetical protein